MNPQKSTDPPSSGANDDGAPHRSLGEHSDIAAPDRNFVLLALFNIVQRVGWIFKTESIVMPAVLDYLGGSGMIRGLLPLANRVCQSLPTIALAPKIRLASRKKIWMLCTTLMMSFCFGSLAISFAIYGEHRVMLQFVFIALYSLFFVATGMNQVLYSTLQGKLVPATRRGRLLMYSNLIGVVAAVGAVWLLLPGWLTASGAEFQYLFATSSIAFLCAAGLTIFLDEPKDQSVQQSAIGFRKRIAEAILPFRSDQNFRRLSVVAALFGASIMLFPHYQSLGRGERLGGDFRSLLLWLTVQNAGTAMFSMIVGPLADRKGSLLALRCTLAGVASAPMVAIVLDAMHVTWAFPFVFVLVGLTPVVIRLLMNYTLEVSPSEQHPAYLAAVNLVAGAPVLLSPIAGALVDVIGFAPVFGVISMCCAIGWYVAGSLDEPRHSVKT